MRAVARGETYLSPPVSKYVIAAYIQRASSACALPWTLASRMTPHDVPVVRQISLLLPICVSHQGAPLWMMGSA